MEPKGIRGEPLLPAQFTVKLVSPPAWSGGGPRDGGTAGGKEFRGGCGGGSSGVPGLRSCPPGPSALDPCVAVASGSGSAPAGHRREGAGNACSGTPCKPTCAARGVPSPNAACCNPRSATRIARPGRCEAPPWLKTPLYRTRTAGQSGHWIGRLTAFGGCTPIAGRWTRSPAPPAMQPGIPQ